MLENISSTKVAGGWHKQYTHTATSTHCTMRFAVFLPPGASETNKVPVLYWLSGLTCTDENFMQKAGAFKKAAELGIAIVAPDTSPRGDNVPDDDSYDFGQGAGFYVNATQAPFNTHFNMYDYVVDELPMLIEQHFPVTSTKAISGHSMGGHGALTLAMANPGQYRSVSAFSPIANPTQSDWGKKQLTAYLGNADQPQLDASLQMAAVGFDGPVLIDQGSEDQFLDLLRPEALAHAMAARRQDGQFRMQKGYDHSYFFVASFIEDHIAFHAEALYQD